MPIIAGRASAAVGAGFSRVVAAAYAGPFGAYDSLATVTLSAATATVTFAGIPAGYKHLQVRYLVKSARTNVPLDELNLSFNGDSSSIYAQHALFGDGASATSNYLTSQNNIELGSGFIGDAYSGSQFGVGVVDILDYSSSSKTKVVRMIGGVDMNGTLGGFAGRVGLGSGLWNNTSSVTSLTFYAEIGNIIEHSQFALYGVK